MRFIDALIHETITNIQTQTRNVYGDLSYTITATEVKCKFNDTPTLSYSSVGVVELSKSTAWVATPTAVEEGNRVTYDGNTYEVLEVQEMYGVDGEMTHKRILLR